MTTPPSLATVDSMVFQVALSFIIAALYYAPQLKRRILILWQDVPGT